MKKQENKKVFLKDFPVEEVYKLFDYLRTLSKTEDINEQNRFISQKIHNFFVDLTILQENELFPLIETRDDNKMKEFIKKYPNIEIDKTGHNKKPSIAGWKVKHDALIYSYNNLSSIKKPNSEQRQILKARTLTCLKNIKPKYSYGSLILMSSKMNTPNLVNINYINNYNNKLKKYFDSELFFRKLLTYYLNTSPKQDIFMKYVFYYLDIIIEDEDSESIIKNEYISTINSIINS